MAISNNPFFIGLSGSIGKMFTIKNYNGKAVVCRRIEKREKPASPAQKANEDKFKAANGYARIIYGDPVKREEARLRLKVPHGNELYRALVKEYRAREK